MLDQIIRLEYEADSYDDILALKAAQQKVDSMERKNLESMGLFASVSTFLVGLLSIFIGNSGSVSIFDKMEYVIALGTILLLFVCVGYFVVNSTDQNHKSKIIGFLTFIFLVIFICCFMGFFSISRNNQSDAKLLQERVIDSENTLKDSIGLINGVCST